MFVLVAALLLGGQSDPPIAGANSNDANLDLLASAYPFEDLPKGWESIQIDVIIGDGRSEEVLVVMEADEFNAYTARVRSRTFYRQDRIRCQAWAVPGTSDDETTVPERVFLGEFHAFAPPEIKADQVVLPIAWHRIKVVADNPDRVGTGPETYPLYILAKGDSVDFALRLPLIDGRRTHSVDFALPSGEQVDLSFLTEHSRRQLGKHQGDAPFTLTILTGDEDNPALPRDYVVDTKQSLDSVVRLLVNPEHSRLRFSFPVYPIDVELEVPCSYLESVLDLSLEEQIAHLEQSLDAVALAPGSDLLGPELVGSEVIASERLHPDYYFDYDKLLKWMATWDAPELEPMWRYLEKEDLQEWLKKHAYDLDTNTLSLRGHRYYSGDKEFYTSRFPFSRDYYPRLLHYRGFQNNNESGYRHLQDIRSHRGGPRSALIPAVGQVFQGGTLLEIEDYQETDNSKTSSAALLFPADANLDAPLYLAFHVVIPGIDMYGHPKHPGHHSDSALDGTSWHDLRRVGDDGIVVFSGLPPGALVFPLSIMSVERNPDDLRKLDISFSAYEFSETTQEMLSRRRKKGLPETWYDAGEAMILEAAPRSESDE